MWLAALSDLVREDKRCFALILRDQMPGKTPGYMRNVRLMWNVCRKDRRRFSLLDKGAEEVWLSF